MSTLESVQYGWGDNSATRDEPFWVRFSKCQSSLSNWKEEIRGAAIDIANKSRRPMWVCLSGGIDSELVCQTFLELGIPFTVLTLAFDDGANAHDIKYAVEWCKENRINQKIVSFNLEKFASRIPYLLDQGFLADHFFRYYQIHLLELVEEMGGFAVLGGGEQLYELNGMSPSFENVSLNFDVGFTAALEWCQQHRTCHEPYFFFSSPGIVASWLRVPLIDFCLRHPDVFVHPKNKYLIKVLGMRIFFPRQKPRPKYNGFENVEHVRHRVQRELRERLGAKNSTYRLKVNELRRQVGLMEIEG